MAQAIHSQSMDQKQVMRHTNADGQWDGDAYVSHWDTYI